MNPMVRTIILAVTVWERMNQKHGVRTMKVPNWQHHSKKEKKRHLKPQALRSARERRRQLIKCLQPPNKGVFSCNIGIYERKLHASSARNQVTTSKVACY